MGTLLIRTVLVAAALCCGGACFGEGAAGEAPAPAGQAAIAEGAAAEGGAAGSGAVIGGSTAPDPFMTLVRLAASMAIVIGLIIGAAVVSKKALARMRFGQGPRKLLEVRQAVNLGGKRQVFVIEAGRHLLVVGAAGENMRLLARLPKDDAAGFDAMVDAIGRSSQDAAREGGTP